MCRPVYIEAQPDEEIDAWLERSGVRVPLKLHSEPVDARSTQGRPPGVDDRTAAVMDVVAKVARCMPDARTIATISAVSRVMAAVERHGVPAVTSTSPLSPDEAAALMRDTPPALTPMDQAFFAAAKRDFDRYSGSFLKENYHAKRQD